MIAKCGNVSLLILRQSCVRLCPNKLKALSTCLSNCLLQTVVLGHICLQLCPNKGDPCLDKAMLMVLAKIKNGDEEHLSGRCKGNGVGQWRTDACYHNVVVVVGV